MHVAPDEALAVRLLADLQEAMTGKDLDAALQVFDLEPVVFGTAVSNLDPDASIAYLQQVLAQPKSLRWAWDDVKVIAGDDHLFCFAAIGTVGFDGDSESERQPMRLTCVAVNRGPGWRLRHFHGSVPQT